MAKLIYTLGGELGNCTYLGNDYWIGKERYASFKCKCGNEFVTSVKAVKTLHTRSCGCLHRETLIKRNTTHGLAKKKEYSLWLNMKQRCDNPNFTKYENWGGRGISVCKEWSESFEAFFRDMGEKPSHCRGLDRIDNDKGYYKENCRWATQSEQCNNKRSNVVIEFNGEKKSLGTWVRELNLKYHSAAYHYRTGTKSISEIFAITKISV